MVLFELEKIINERLDLLSTVVLSTILVVCMITSNIGMNAYAISMYQYEHPISNVCMIDGQGVACPTGGTGMTTGNNKLSEQSSSSEGAVSSSSSSPGPSSLISSSSSSCIGQHHDHSCNTSSSSNHRHKGHWAIEVANANKSFAKTSSQGISSPPTAKLTLTPEQRLKIQCNGIVRPPTGMCILPPASPPTAKPPLSPSK